ncbi:TetR/AcrR family transcriptional regulator [Compostimonas suwonensis]|uniref:AcrR family transcriptional regulator n=1 Tax=Compostimonas suwonensis TaxID=1048394 RepID=A0A2M9C098_9MICO|nr:TetR/AcrR family transcriptional regulator [Compostimonas suwonensis]PJJ63759.1 AcrR family transcriptional regulator [Compostimonas suwonensis]
MNESATLTRASQRKLATASRLTALCRQLTAERGLNGFTIEEVCSEVGVSRRTFFNYFPSKEDAVVGVDEAGETRRFIEEFRARGSRGWPAVIDDLVDFAIQATNAAGLGSAEHAEFVAILEREPRLLARVIGMGRVQELKLVKLVSEREGVPLDDPLARAAVDVATAVLRSTADRLSDPRVAADFGAALLDSLAALRAVTAPAAS